MILNNQTPAGFEWTLPTHITNPPSSFNIHLTHSGSSTPDMTHPQPTSRITRSARLRAANQPPPPQSTGRPRHWLEKITDAGSSDVDSARSHDDRKPTVPGRAVTPELNPYGGDDLAQVVNQSDTPMSEGEHSGPVATAERPPTRPRRPIRQPRQGHVPLERTVNGVPIPPGAPGAPRQSVRPTLGLTLEGFLARSRIHPGYP
jgi:hypothetical protein